MIVPMKKVSLVVLNSERKHVLKKLRSLSIVHLEQLEGSGEKLEALKADYKDIQKAKALLSDIALAKNSKFNKQKVVTIDETLEKTKKIFSLFEQKKELLNVIAANTKELDRLKKWGGVTPADFDYLSGKGVYLSLYEISNSKYLHISESVQTVFVNRDKSQTRFLLLTDDGIVPDAMPAEAFSIVMPTKSTSELSTEIEDSYKALDTIAQTLQSYCVYKDALDKALEKRATHIEFENAYTGMWSDKDAEVTEVPAFSKDLAWVSGYLPAEKASILQKTAKENQWALLVEEPTEEDNNVPTKLRNNKLVSLIYPVTDFLGTVPGYHEYDISGWFLLFFTIFFGMIWGDAGYGALLA
ncbi:MAG TPA: ATPase, partial [Treponemataceae bacterium]|nr:ATPase [Treponemataceae bacterium]